VVKIRESNTGARLVILSDDHCPPHVHAHHKTEGWIVRLWFSFASNAVGVMSIAPTANTVRQRQLNQMLDEITADLGKFREIWWESQKTTCLENKWLRRISLGAMAVLDVRHAEAKQVLSAQYDVGTRTTAMIFRDGTRDSVESGITE
jgi:hypothetical protein